MSAAIVVPWKSDSLGVTWTSGYTALAEAENRAMLTDSAHIAPAWRHTL